MNSSVHLLIVADQSNATAPLIIGFVILFVLLLMSALISGSEVAFFSLTPADLEELDNDNSKASKIASNFLDKPRDLLATILIANNFINVGIIILSTYLSVLIFPDDSLSVTAKFVIDVVVITFLLLLFGEVIPKIYATKNGKKMSLLMARPLYFVSRIPPFSWLKIGLVRGTAILGKAGKKRAVKISTDMLSQAVELTIGEHADQADKKIWHDIVRFGEKDVKQIMIPRVDVEAIDVNTDFAGIYTRIVNSRFSRLPVFSGSFDKIEGVLIVKDLLPHIDEKADFDWKKLLKEPFFVPENKKIDDLMVNFQEMKMHMALVVDEYGGISGIVTLQDVLEEIVGDITDEFDEDDVTYSKLDDFNYVFEGKTSLIDVYKILEIDGTLFENAKSESDTLAGFVIEQAGKILKKGEKVKFEQYTFTIEAADARKVKRIKMSLNKAEDEKED